MTLVEVLMALAVLSLIGVLLAQGLHVGTRVWDRGRDNIEELSDRAQTALALRRLLSAAEPPGPVDSATTFVGEAHRLRFHSTAAARLTGGADRRIEIVQDPRAGVVKMHLHDPAGGHVDEDLVLYESARKLDFRYRHMVDGKNKWSLKWDNPIRLPEIVEITIGFATSAAPEVITIPVRRQYSTECLVVGLQACGR